MNLIVVRLAALLFTAISMSAGLAHVFELAHKIGMSREQYLSVQVLYQGWALIGIAVVGAIVCLSIVAVQVRARPRVFGFTVAAAACVALSLVVFFVFTLPVNRATANWTTMPDNWAELRSRWEYSHVVGAGLYVVALLLFGASLIVDHSNA